MPKTNHNFFARNNHEVCNTSLRYKITVSFLILFVLSLPFNAIEWNIAYISRFEIKLTMITFFSLFICWLVDNLKHPRKRCQKEILFYSFAVMYGASQFASVINSPFPLESLKQGIIIVSLLIMLIVTSETILDKEMAEYVLTVIGTLSLLIGIIAVLNYYFISGYTGRLGQGVFFTLGIIDLGGDSYYFGDILLYSIGPVFFVLLKLSKRKYWSWLIPLFLMLWFSSIVLTFSKGLMLSVICFLLCSTFLLKGKRSFILLTAILFVATIILNSIGLDNYLKMPKQLIKPKLQIEERLNIFNSVGLNSVSIRLKAIKISLKSSLNNLWFGHGAGLSQKLLPQLGSEYDRTTDNVNRALMKKNRVYGDDANKSLIDSHVFFLTEFFNVGLVGLIFLLSLVVFVIVEQVKTIRADKNEKDNMNELLFATLISMLVYRLCGSLIVIPFLWFMLGLGFGVCKLYWKS